jgi:type IV secretory pathway VirB10-like protein
MTAPGAGGTRPARAAGLLLMGIAVIAVVLGVITLVDGNAENNGGTSQPPTASTTTATRPSGQTTTANPPASTPSTQTPAPPSTQTNTNTPPPPPPNPKQVPVRVFNNSKISGLAERARNDFQAGGWNVVETGNHQEPVIPTSTAFFRPGTDEEAAARALAAQFNLDVAPRSAAVEQHGGSGVLVIVTKDYGIK